MTATLCLGPLLFNWPAEQRRDFYFRIADEAPVDVVYFGEVVCGKRTPLFDAYFDRVLERLRAAGIPSRPYFAPIHMQPYFQERFDYHPGDFPVVGGLGRRSLALPFSGVMTEAQVELVCERLKAVLAEI